MKSIKDFENNKLINDTICFGGKHYWTSYCDSNNEEVCDSWEDHDNDGKISSGDLFCIVECR